jgi:hypothetical protein
MCHTLQSVTNKFVGSQTGAVGNRRGHFSGLKLVRCPHSLAPTLVTLPSMSRVPHAQLTKARHADLLPRSVLAANERMKEEPGEFESRI